MEDWILLADELFTIDVSDTCSDCNELYRDCDCLPF